MPSRKDFGSWLDDSFKKHSYRIGYAKSGTIGLDGSTREYRIHPIDTNTPPLVNVLDVIPDVLVSYPGSISRIKFNEISVNSSKFPSFSFTIEDVDYDLVIASNGNGGHKFEKQIIDSLRKAIFDGEQGTKGSDLFTKLVDLGLPDKQNIANVSERKGSTRKSDVPIEHLGSVVGDAVVTTKTGEKHYISLKSAHGDTFSSYSGAKSLFDGTTLDQHSFGAKFLQSFGVNLNTLQESFDTRNGIILDRQKIPATGHNKYETTDIMRRAWGCNYYYARDRKDGWETFFIDDNKLKTLADVEVERIVYPSETSKQLTINCSSPIKDYRIEIRNSKGGEYPNDIKFRVR